MVEKYTNIKERVLQIAEYKGISKEKFLDDIGMTYGSFKGKAKEGTLNSDAIVSIYIKHSDISIEWLLTGQGDMVSVVQKRIRPKISEEGSGVPYYDVDFIGGFDLIMNERSIRPAYYIDFFPFNDADYWVNINGKSMSPLVSHGDIVALKKFDTWRDFILYGEIYAIITNEFRTIKIIGEGKDDNHLSLIPYNNGQEYIRQNIPKRIIRNIFKVKGSIKKFF